MKEIIKKCKSKSQQIVDNYKSPTPKWAKIVGHTGIVIGAIGLSIVSAPLELSAGILYAGKIMIFGGGAMKGIFQGFKKK